MNRDILSLKNIYKFLTAEDYPIYSSAVISRSHKKGLTLSRFCDENILMDFRNQKCGKMIWRTKGARNRYISDVCNRSNRLPIYSEYAQEVMEAIDYDSFYRQIQQFISFLNERQYQLESFQKRMPAFLEMLEREDEIFSEAALEYFREMLEKQQLKEGVNGKIETFCCSWFLSFFVIYGLLGNGAKEYFLCSMREDLQYSLPKMLERYQAESVQGQKDITILTDRNTEISVPALSAGQFFGRETELFELKEMIIHREKVLLSGMGGIGKTELLRQVLRRCREECFVEYVCLVQYEVGIARSLIKAFTHTHGADLSENFKEVLSYIRTYEKEKLVLFIDNVDGEVDEAELLALSSLPVSIVMTSRCNQLKGFKTYNLEAIDKSAGSLIFRDNYEGRICVTDKQILQKMLENQLWCHTLTLRLLARVAKTKGWSIARLYEELEQGRTQKDLQQIYLHMYKFAALSEEENMWLRVLAALPYDVYASSWICKYIIGDAETSDEILTRMWEAGWLEKYDNGYSMHPFVSECILSVRLKEVECFPFLDRVMQSWREKEADINLERIIGVLLGKEGLRVSEMELVDTTLLVGSVFHKISEKLSERYRMLYLLAAAIEASSYGITESGKQMVQKVAVGITELPEEMQQAIHFMQCNYLQGDICEQRACFDRIKQDVSKSEDVCFGYGEVLSTRYFLMGELEEAESISQYALGKESEDAFIMNFYNMRALIAMQKGEFHSYAENLEHAIEIGRKLGLEQNREMQIMLSNLADYCIVIGQFEEAERLLEELEQIPGYKYCCIRQQILQRRGSLERQRGTEGFGIAYFQESCELAEDLFLHGEKWNYASLLVELAMAYNKNSQFEESEKTYKTALAIYENLTGFAFEKHRILNNMSVMFLDRGAPKDALLYLPKAYEQAKAFGGLALGETANNLSRAWRMLRERKKELLYLEEALPILEQFYGPEHPKVVDAKARLTE